MRAKSVLIVAPENADGDIVASVLALGQAIDKCLKQTTLVCPGEIPQSVDYLKGFSQIKKTLGLQSLVVSVDVEESNIEKVGYFTKDNKFNLMVTPKEKIIDPKKISFYLTGLNADLVIMVGATSFEKLGALSKEYAEELKKITTINIDCQLANELYGKVNMVDSSHASCAELVLPLVNELGVEWDTDLSLALLTGIYIGTDSFKSENVTSHTFQNVLELLGHGANLSMVVRNLYRRENKSDILLPTSDSKTIEETIPEKQNAQDGDSPMPTAQPSLTSSPDASSISSRLQDAG